MDPSRTFGEEQKKKKMTKKKKTEENFERSCPDPIKHMNLVVGLVPPSSWAFKKIRQIAGDQSE
jgi:hypothetical protein